MATLINSTDRYVYKNLYEIFKKSVDYIRSLAKSQTAPSLSLVFFSPTTNLRTLGLCALGVDLTGKISLNHN